MGIKRWYEISCDNCGWAKHYLGNIEISEKNYKEDGGIIKISYGEKLHYCCIECYEEGFFK